MYNSTCRPALLLIMCSKEGLVDALLFPSPPLIDIYGENNGLTSDFRAPLSDLLQESTSPQLIVFPDPVKMEAFQRLLSYRRPVCLYFFPKFPKRGSFVPFAPPGFLPEFSGPLIHERA